MSLAILPEPCRQHLSRLLAAKKIAEREYDLALTSAVSAIGLDPAQPLDLNLDTGVITARSPEAPAASSPAADDSRHR